LIRVAPGPRTHAFDDRRFQLALRGLATWRL
jgi:hypothetical protein